MQNQIFGNKIVKIMATLSCVTMLAVLTGCGDGGIAPGGTTTAAATLQLTATSTSVPSDNSGSITITVTALSASNAALPGIVVALSTDTGVVSASTVTTGADGTATFTFKSGTASLANRTATVTASAGATANITIQIAGSTLTVFSMTGSNVPNDGTSPVTVTFIAKNAQGAGLANTSFTASAVSTTGGQVSLDKTSGTTDTAGKFAILVSGTGAPATGTATVSAIAAGSTASATITVSTPSATFGITKTTNSTGSVVTLNPTAVAMQIGDQLTVTVSSPTTNNVEFLTTQGTWVGGTSSITAPVVGGVASAVLTQSVAGSANVQVSDTVNSALTDSLVVGVTAVNAYKVLLTASPTVVPKTTGTSILIATVLDVNNQPVGNAPVVFSLSNTTGGGESVSPVKVYTSAISGGNLGLGQATATFTSGSLSSTSSGVQVRAAVNNTAVATNTAPSSPDAAIVIGGTAGSIAFSIATKLIELNTTTYQLPVSVQVTDSNGNSQANQTVNLSIWPIAWSTGTVTACAKDADNAIDKGTFYNEDVNGNLILDQVSPGVNEDGYRKYYSSGGTVGGGTADGLLTPVNSAAGSVPASITTDATGVANFNITYLKSSAIWTKVRLRASTTVQGTEAVSQHIFDLPALVGDVSPICYLSSPYTF